MEKITRLNWFKKVFGGVAALCAMPFMSAVKPVRKLGYALPNNPNLTVAEKAALIREFAHDDDLVKWYLYRYDPTFVKRWNQRILQRMAEAKAQSIAEVSRHYSV